MRLAPLALALCACDPLGGLTIVGDDPSDVPIDGLEAHWLDRFGEGDSAFDEPFRESTGLGPLYIRVACASCHEDDGRGPGAVHKMSVLGPDGRPSADQSALMYGPTRRPLVAAGATSPIEPPPGVPILESRRFGPAVFGRGYIEAIADGEIERVEREQGAAGRVSGRIHRVPFQSQVSSEQPFHTHGPGTTGLIGRFGLKARIATLDDFAADAYQGDMGITSPLRPSELPNPEGLTDDARPGVDLDAQTVNAVADYVRLLAIPTRREVPGAELFERTGCADCHVPSMRTRADYPIAVLADIDAPIYSDLLLHDMGAGLEDGVRDLDASGREWRTAPLIGLRHLTVYLHDGRARSVEEAIDEHDSEGSEARPAVASYRALSSADRAALVQFVSSL
ncbi:MAG: hypothetical protein K8H88_30280 [Sandaracinaceae bacterium]|nr:hypothetical protein [Sandaracinaceae bacterium]